MLANESTGTVASRMVADDQKQAALLKLQDWDAGLQSLGIEPSGGGYGYHAVLTGSDPRADCPAVVEGVPLRCTWSAEPVKGLRSSLPGASSVLRQRDRSGRGWRFNTMIGWVRRTSLARH